MYRLYNASDGVQPHNGSDAHTHTRSLTLTHTHMIPCIRMSTVTQQQLSSDMKPLLKSDMKWRGTTIILLSHWTHRKHEATRKQHRHTLACTPA